MPPVTTPTTPMPRPAPEGQSRPDVSTPAPAEADPTMADTEMWRPPAASATGPTATREPTIGSASARPPGAPAEPALPGMEAKQKKPSEGAPKAAEGEGQKDDDAEA